MSNKPALFGSFHREEAQKDAEDLNNGKNFLTKLPMGRTVLRILPPKVGQKKPWVVVWEHFIRYPGVERPVIFNCPEKMSNQRCPACAQANRLEHSGNPTDYEAAEQYKPRFRVYANVIDRSNPEKGPLVWAFGMSIFKRLLYFRENEDVYGRDFTDPFNGRDVVIDRSGEAKQTRYLTDLGQVDKPLAKTEEQLVEWASKMEDLAAMASVVPYDALVERLKKARSNAGGGGAATTSIVAQARQAAPAQQKRSVETSVEDVDDGDLPF